MSQIRYLFGIKFYITLQNCNILKSKKLNNNRGGVDYENIDKGV